MKKKVLFLSAGIMIAGVSFGQKKQLNEAKSQLEKATTASADKKTDEATAAFQKAKEAIDAAATNPETKDKPETWMTRAGIYVGMQEQAALNADNPYLEGITSLKKAIELKKSLESDGDMVRIIANAAFFSYNNGIKVYNDSKYSDAYELFRQGTELLGPDKDKRFALMPVMDTVRAQSRMFMGYSAYYADKFDDAIANLSAMKESPYLQKESNIYLVLAMAYEKKGNTAQQLATLAEGKKKFPGDKNLENAELNYYINSGKQDEMTAKLEEAIAKDPANPELQMNLGIVYGGMATSKGLSDEAKAGYMGKADAAYKKALELAPGNGSYQYQVGAFYFNQAAEFNSAMNNLGMSKEDQAKYNKLLKQRDEYFAISLPYLEKAKDIYGAKGRDQLRGEEGKYYFNTLTALKEIYTRQDQTDKAGEIKRKINELNGK